MSLTQATTYIDDATAYKMEVQGHTAYVEYEMQGTIPATIKPHWDNSTQEWRVSLHINESGELRSTIEMEEYLNTLDDVVKVAEAFHTVLNQSHRPQAA
ncbi:hypothetical protein [Corynebacterium accolens]|uniref:hypothetical protein n=1 Tax=Corynebacterium accolens TaxID=38284 RepID=UPI00254D72E8|nr:hypothetical protein [Corynebacterium accolens]MDK8505580.1 hypothetical protein [Corynebacterium accolens]MDK8662430.1 hypothetical protein [Corynebacterium accolens]